MNAAHAERRQLIGLTTLLLLQKNARHAAELAELAFIAVNDTRQLLEYRQAALWQALPQSKVAAVSGIALVDPHAPYVTWLQRLGEHLGQGPGENAAAFQAEDLPPELREDWKRWLPRHALWLPFPAKGGPLPGALLLARDQAWNEGEIHLLGELADAYGHAWQALQTRSRWWRDIRIGRKTLWLVLTTALIFCLPIRQSVLAPAEVVAADPTIVRSPLQGVVDHFQIEPNLPVEKDQLLLTLEDTDLKNRLEVAKKSLAVAEADYRRAAQSAVFDDKSKAELTILKGRMEQHAAEVSYMEDLLVRSRVTAPHAGIAIFSDEHDWMGRPVEIGERLLMVADPHDVELEIRLPVADFIRLEDNAEVAMFLNIAPQRPIEARLHSASYQAEVTTDDVLAYRLKARYLKNQALPRIGLRGTAKLYGQRVTLFYYVFRRPLAALRQWLGL
ncbi:HlyD family efflux transporter periplasmic adaptor subunit [Methylocaldum sp.]|uniref:HlyD family efflux transporter periplasmic adaptor subunit n=1 Tax=Methylocaldum sp. TaxID=1969727 RepID=UPI002D5B382A|nr:HlyD family efflux transporter periplasmic adaptor subunit [Methylocaldum sp.]HYE36512.1 HlyD family efflux transporter periplasmic adaptor subunit [Methylocaldum sp.]